MKAALYIWIATGFLTYGNWDSLAYGQSAAQIGSRMDQIRMTITQIDQDRDEFDAKGKELNSQYARSDRQYEPSDIDELVNKGHRQLQAVKEYDDVISHYSSRCVSVLSQYSELSKDLAMFRSAMDSAAQNQRDLATGNEEAQTIYLQLQRAYHNHDTDRWNALVDQSATLGAKNKQSGEEGRLKIAFAESLMSDAQTTLRRMLDSLQNDLVRARNAESRAKMPPWVETVSTYLESRRGSIPLSFLLGWIDKESQGNLAAKSSKNERGYFQINPAEWCYLQGKSERAHCLESLNHTASPKLAFTDPKLESSFKKLSSDQGYSLEMGLLLVRMDASNIKRMDLGCSETNNSDFFWRLVKLNHATNLRSVEHLVQDMKKDHISPDSWLVISEYVHEKDNQKKLQKETGFDFSGWVESIDDLFKKGTALAAK